MFDRKEYIEEESPVKNVLLKLFKKNEPIIIFDVGACEGEESIRYKKMFSEASIFLFEPLPKNQELIFQNIKKYNLDNVKLVPLALSNKDGFTDFYISSGQPEELQKNFDWDFGNKSSSLLEPQIEHLPKWLKFSNVINVETVTLNSFLEKENIKNVDFVHMDVQGAELKVLMGAREKISSIKSIWLEVSDIELYKNQPLRNEIELFMIENNFYLIKSEFSGQFGDQFYLNKKYYYTFSLFWGKIQFYFKKSNRD
ncbi:FkbM family methyltransferase [Flavobacterium johnsoniae]|uniref:FkbM family methyltransferase n=1 Tax=Flavobacterium johnsoniae TaxID=986 RepID=UPI0025B17B65|nr:FkbM family methyltransferase [Flavobacterium johnsoniae]WJS95141.1 FkbM family methyltransferase [Flavobacterium johnsoniae]